VILRCVIDGAPVGKGRGRAVRQGPGVRIVTPKTTRDWEARAAGELADAYDGETITDPVRVEVLAVKARPQRLRRRKDPEGLIWRPHKPDADNVAKAVCDALEKSGVIANDIQVVELVARSVFAERDGEPRVVVTVDLVPELPVLEETPADAEDEAGFHDDADLPADAAALYAAMADQSTRTAEGKAAFRALLAEYQRITGTGQPLVQWFDETVGTDERGLMAVLEGDDAPPADAPAQLALLGAAR